MIHCGITKCGGFAIAERTDTSIHARELRAFQIAHIHQRIVFAEMFRQREHRHDIGAGSATAQERPMNIEQRARGE